jgi:hypothetical protein
MEDTLMDLNIIDSRLVKILQESAGKEELAVILSSGFSIVHGYYSTHMAREISARPKIRYLNDDFDAEHIAKCIANNDISELLPLVPFVVYSSRQRTESGLYFHLLIASHICDDKRGDIAKYINSAWKQKAGYDLNFPSKDL